MKLPIGWLREFSDIELPWAPLLAVLLTAGLINAVAGGGSILTVPVLAYGLGHAERLAIAAGDIGTVLTPLAWRFQQCQRCGVDHGDHHGARRRHRDYPQEHAD